MAALCAPLQLADLELCAPIGALPQRDGTAGIRFLVRLLGAPVAWLDVPASDAALEFGVLRSRSLREAAAAIARELAWLALAQPLPRRQLDVVELLAASTARRSAGAGATTVAVCTRDRTADLEVCLTALGRLRTPGAELLVVDNAPATDATEAMVRQRFPHVRYLREARPGLNWARNRAAAEARGEIIAYTDDDVAPEPEWLDVITESFRAAPDVAAVTGFVAPSELETSAQVSFEAHRGYTHPDHFTREWFRLGPGSGGAAARFGTAGMFGSGANMAYRTAVLRTLGGFDPALDVGTASRGGGDLEMFFRVLKEGHVLVREPAAVVRHRHRRTDAELRAQIGTWGVGMHSYLLRSGLAYPDERGALRMLHLRWLLLRNPRRLLRALAARPRRTGLVWAEMSGSVLAATRYRQARREAERLAAAFGEPPLLPTLARYQTESAPEDRPRHSAPPGLHSVDLAESLPTLGPVRGVRDVHVEVSWAGSRLGRVVLRGGGAGVPAAWLRAAIAAELGSAILGAAGVTSREVTHGITCLAEARS